MGESYLRLPEVSEKLEDKNQKLEELNAEANSKKEELNFKINNRDAIKSLIEDNHGLKQGKQEESWTIYLNNFIPFACFNGQVYGLWMCQTGRLI